MTKLKDISGYDKNIIRNHKYQEISYTRDVENLDVGIDEKTLQQLLSSLDPKGPSRRLAKAIIQNESKILRIKNGT